MDINLIDGFTAAHIEKFPENQIQNIREKLKSIENSKFDMIQSYPYKDTTTILVVSIFAGFFGIDRYMLDQPALGTLKLITCGGLGIWKLIDWFLIQEMTREYNLKKFNQIIGY